MFPNKKKIIFTFMFQTRTKLFNKNDFYDREQTQTSFYFFQKSLKKISRFFNKK